jgi:hypothetical protein
MLLSMSDPKARFQTTALRITQHDSEVLTYLAVAAVAAAKAEQDQYRWPPTLAPEPRSSRFQRPRAEAT